MVCSSCRCSMCTHRCSVPPPPATGYSRARHRAVLDCPSKSFAGKLSFAPDFASRGPKGHCRLRMPTAAGCGSTGCFKSQAEFRRRLITNAIWVCPAAIVAIQLATTSSRFGFSKGGNQIRRGPCRYDDTEPHMTKGIVSADFSW